MRFMYLIKKFMTFDKMKTQNGFLNTFRNKLKNKFNGMQIA